MSDIANLEEQRKDMQAQVDLRDRILRLSENADFRAIVRENFFVEACAGFVRESVNPALPAEARERCLAFAQSAGYFKQWLNNQILLGNQAAQTIFDIDNTIDELRAEDAADEAGVEEELD